jgi:arsenate reductase (thioredoxin)
MVGVFSELEPSLTCTPLLIVLVALTSSSHQSIQGNNMILSESSQFGAPFYPALQEYLLARIAEFSSISSDRKPNLAKVANYVRACMVSESPAKLTFICTHNSRRSHLSQIWAQVAADYFGISNVEAFSGGTEATAFNPRAISALQRCGLKITTANADTPNPTYEVKTSDNARAQICFSKVHDTPPNPTKGYCAIMTCSQADEACPRVMGCDLRVPIRYEDPKISDDTDQEAAVYDERSRQICCEMLFMMSMVNASV